MSACPFHKLRGDLPPDMPARIARLPVDARGYPVPWFVLWLPDGTPEFRIGDLRKFRQAIDQKLCWVCGERLKKSVAFVLGPMCTVTRTSGEPPSHVGCAEWSVKACPFLIKPQMKRREYEEIEKLGASRGHMIARNPGCSAVWITTRYKTFGDGKGGTLIEVGNPLDVSWWREGRAATRVEVTESIESGLPLLYAADNYDVAATAEINAKYEELKKLLPQ